MTRPAPARVLALAVLVGGQVWLAGLRHLVLNAGFALATVAILAATVFGTAVAQRSQARAQAWRDDVAAVLAAMLARERDAVDTGLADAARGLTFAGWACLLAGVAATALAWAGVSRRLVEYR